MAEPVLKKGSNDPAVRDLQAALKALGHDPGPVDGVFGPATEAAVKAFQQEREIAACRPASLASMSSSCCNVSRQLAVRRSFNWDMLSSMAAVPRWPV